MRVLITGASRGIGLALAQTYRAEGHDVIAAARSGGDVDLDVTDAQSCKALAQALKGTPIDLLICNAGVYLDKHQTMDGYPAQMWDQTFATNVTGVFLTVQALLPNLRFANGKIAIISSQMASQENAPGGSYIYRASKAAALNLGRNLAADLKPDGLAVGIYHPGWVRTDMGGPSGDIDVQASVDGLVQRFADLSCDTTGCFKTWDGRDHPY